MNNIERGIVKIKPVGSQHFSMTFGHWLPAMIEAGDLLGFEVQHL